MGTQARADSDGDRWAAVLAPDFESIDHRRLGTWSVRGAAGFLDHLRALENISRQLRDDTFCRFLKQAKTADDIWQLLEEADNNQFGS